MNRIFRDPCRIGMYLLCALSFQSCIYSTHQFHGGRVLQAGKTAVTAGVGHQRFDTETLMKYSVNYRFGVSDSFLIFPGAELAWHLEAPTNPGTMEFETTIGLPSGRWNTWHHSLSLGWGIGMWADNSLFAGYAAGISWKTHHFFSNVRATRVATQLFELFDDDIDTPLKPDPRWVVQTATGAQIALPAWPLVPRFIIPQAIVTFPEIPAGPNAERVVLEPQIQGNLGMGWTF